MPGRRQVLPTKSPAEWRQPAIANWKVAPVSHRSQSKGPRTSAAIDSPIRSRQKAHLVFRLLSVGWTPLNGGASTAAGSVPG